MAKLVLDIEPTLIDRIKNVAEKRKLSISELTATLFIKETEEEAPIVINRDELPDWIKQLTLSKQPTPDFDHKKEYGDHIMRKYGL